MKQKAVFGVVVALACALCLALAACGSGSSTSATSASGSSASSAGAVPSAASSATSSAATSADSASASDSSASSSKAPRSEMGLDELKDLREVSWEGKELTVTVGSNKTTSCNWRNTFENDKIVGYSVNRVFTLSDVATKQGVAAGTLAMGFEGKSAGTAKVFCTSDADWEGNKPGYSFAVVVTVNEDCTIASVAIEE